MPGKRENASATRTVRAVWILLVAVVAAAAFPALARATDQTVRDRNDRFGSLDIRTATAVHSSAAIRHTITTFDSWGVGLIGQSTPHYLALGLDLRGDANFEEFVLFISRSGRVRALLVGPNGRLLGTLPASRPNGKSVSVRIPRAHFAGAGGYRWAAFTVFEAAHGTVIDRAPDRRLIAHDAFGPVIELLSFPDPSTVASSWNTVNVTLRITDTGRHASGVSRWAFQYRREGGPWQNAGWLDGGGDKTVTVGGEEGVNWRFRAVARDRHGNTTVSGERRVSIPYDNSNGVFAGAWSGSWEGVYPPPGSPYMGGLVQTTVPGSAFTHTFSGSSFLWIAPGAPSGGPGTASVAIDGGTPVVVEQSAASGDRAIVYEVTGLDPTTPHTIVISHLTGVISVDAIVIR